MKTEPATACPMIETSYYLIHGVEVVVECGHQSAHERIRRHLEPYLCPPGGGAEERRIRVEIRSEEVLYPTPLHARRLMHYGRLRSYFLDGRHYFTDYFSNLTIEPDGRLIRGNLSQVTEKDYGLHFFVDLLFHLSLFEALRHHGLYYLHAAAVEGEDGTGYLMIGNAGSGKTSLTLSLIQAGFKHLSDDTVFLQICPQGVEVLGFIRDFHVARDLIQDSRCFSHLDSLPDYTPYRAKKRLRADEWFPEARRERLLNPEVLIFPRLGGADKTIGSTKKSGLTPLPYPDTLSQILRQSPTVILNPATARPHLEALKRLLRRGRGFALELGLEVKDDPAAARGLFEQARDLSRQGDKI